MFTAYKENALALALICAGALAPLSRALAADTLAFNRFTIQAPFKLTHPLLPADILPAPGKEVIAFGVDDKGQKWLAVYGFAPQSQKYEVLRQLALAPGIYGFDIGDGKETNDQGLYLLSSEQVLRLSPGEEGLTVIANVRSLSLSPRAEFISRIDFVRDLNGDKQDDLLIGDFNEVHLLLSQADGKYRLQDLPIKAQVQQLRSGASYSLAKTYVADMDLDGRVDLVNIGEGEFEVYRQQEDGGFGTSAWYIPSRLAFSAREWWDQRDAYGETPDQSNLMYRKVQDLRDINQDGLADLVVRYTRSSGVFDKANDYEIYLGEAKDGKLAFQSEPSSLVKTGGTLIDFKFTDVDQDEKAEVLVTGLDIGLTQIIGALISGSIDQDVHLFEQDAQSKFGKHARISKRVEMKFSLTSGQSGSPVVALADFNGDGIKDLLLSDGDKQLNIFFAHKSAGPGDELFASRAEKLSLTLPQDGEMLITEDLDGDGKEDILINYGRQDDAELQSSFTILHAG
jgi:hypothetical protein